jgi:hypothetical protein
MAGDLIKINAAALRYWSSTSFSNDTKLEICKQLDHKYLIATIDFSAISGVTLTISHRAYELKLGHPGAIKKFFTDIYDHPLLRGRSGKIVVLLEDAIHDFDSPLLHQIPLFTFGRTNSNYHSLLMPDPAYTWSEGYKDELLAQHIFEQQYPIETRKPVLFWRGAASGTHFSNIETWKDAPRARLAILSKEMGDTNILDASCTTVSHLSENVLQSIRNEGIVQPYMEFQEFFLSRFLIDIDGIASAWISLFRKLHSNSVVVKIPSPYKQWYYDDLQAWKHYVPMNITEQEVRDVHRWLIEHPEQCSQISEAARGLMAELSYQQTREHTARLLSVVFDMEQHHHRRS